MSVQNRIGKLGVAAVLVLFAACQGDDVVGPPAGGNTVSASEAAAMSNLLVANAFGGLDFSAVAGGGGGGASLRSGVPITIDYAVSVTSPCPVSGDLSVSGAISGSIDDQTLAGNLNLDVVTSANSCAFLHEETQFTLDTDPDLVLAGGFAFDQGALVGEAVFTYTGTLQWATDDGRSGSCSYDVSVTASDTGSTSESGTICGASI